MNPLENFDRAAATAARIIGAIRPEQLALPTACTDWTVRDVVNHVVLGNLRTIAWAGGTEPPSESDRVGDDPAGAFAQSVDQVRATLAEPGLFERMVTTPIGTAPGVILVRMRVNEYLAHGWDIADATGQPTDFAPDLAKESLAEWQQRAATVPRAPGGPVGAARPASPEASAADRLAAFLGRAPVHSR